MLTGLSDISQRWLTATEDKPIQQKVPGEPATTLTYKHVSMLFPQSDRAVTGHYTTPWLCFFLLLGFFHSLLHPFAPNQLFFCFQVPASSMLPFFLINAVSFSPSIYLYLSVPFNSSSAQLPPPSSVVVRQGGLCLTALVWICACLCVRLQLLISVCVTALCTCVSVCEWVGESLGGSPPLSSQPSPRDGCVFRELAPEEKRLQLAHIKFCWANTTYQHAPPPHTLFFLSLLKEAHLVCALLSGRQRRRRAPVWKKKLALLLSQIHFMKQLMEANICHGMARISLETIFRLLLLTHSDGTLFSLSFFCHWPLHALFPSCPVWSHCLA